MAIKFLSAIDHGAYQLPTVDGSNGQVLTTDGNGNVTFQSVAAASNYYLSGASFNTGTGVLTLTVSGAANQTVDLDGRYALSSHTHSYDNYQSWNLKTNGVQRTTVQSGGTLDLVAGSNVSLSYSAGGVVTITSTDTNTDTNDIDYVNAASFNTSTGILSLTGVGNAGASVDLDGRYLTGLPSSTGTLTTFTNAVTIQSNSDGILNLRQMGLGGTAGVKEGGWNYIQFFDSENDRQGYFGIDSSGHFLFNPEVANAEVRMNRLLRVSAGIVGTSSLTLTGAITASGYNDSNWNTAYNWGNHASAGYLTSIPSEYLTENEGDARYLGINAKAADSNLLDGLDSSAFLRSNAADTATGALTFSGGLNMSNSNITNVNHITIGDPGPGEGITWGGGNGWSIYESPNDLSTNSAGNLQFVNNGTRAMTLDTSNNLYIAGSISASGNISQWTNDAGYITDGNTNWNNSYGFITASSADTLTNKSGNISQWTNDSGYITSYVNTTYSAGSGLTLSGTTFAHADTSSQSSVNNSGRTYIQDITLDTYGHITAITSATETVTNTDTITRVGTASNETTGTITLVAGGATTISQSGGSITISSTDTNTDTNNYLTGASFNTSNGVLTLTRQGLGDITVDLDGRFTDNGYADALNQHLRTSDSPSFAGMTINGNLTVTGTTVTDQVEVVSTSNGILFEGSAADAYEGLLLAGTLTADRTYTLPNATGTVALTSDIPTVNNATLTVQGTGALGGSGTFTANASSNVTISISHDDTSTLSGAYGGSNNGVVIEDITVDGYGHVTAIGTRDLDGRFDNYGGWRISDSVTSELLGAGDTLTVTGAGATTVSYDAGTNTLEITSTDTNTNTTYSAGSGLSLSGTTFSHSDTSSASSVNNSGRTYIQDITIDTYGHVTAIASATETVTNTDTNYYVTGASFNTGNGIVTLTRNDGGTVTVDLDGRYQAAGSYAYYDHFRSLGVPAFTAGGGSNSSITTDQLIAEMESDGAFDSYTSAFKTSWSYAGNDNLTNAGSFTETAGTSWLTWTDNSSDSSRGNITALAIAPNSGSSAYGVYIYNDQGSGYSPGWREIWTDKTLNPIVSATVSNDTTTYVKADGSSFSLTTSDANSNTYVTGASFNTGDGVLTLTRNSGSVTVDLDGRYQLSGTYNTIIGTDTDINTSGSTIIDNIYVTDGVITSMGTRTLTLADLGYTGATNADAYGSWRISDGTNSESLGSGATLTVTGTGATTASYDAASNTLTINSTDTNTNTTYSAGSGLSLSGTTFSHSDTSSQSSVNNSGRTYIQDITLDTYGHVTGITSATETVTNTDTITRVGISGSEAAGTITFVGSGATSITQVGTTVTVTSTDTNTNTTYSAGSGLSLSGTTFSHTDTSSQASVNNSGNTVIQDVTLDTYGHVTGLASKTLTLSGLGYTGASNADLYNYWTIDVQGQQSNITSTGILNIQGTGATNVTYDPVAKMVTIDSTDTNTNTTYSADGNYGLTLSGTTFRLEDDRRRNSSTTDIYTGNTHDYTFYDASVGIRWYTAGAEEMRLQDNGTLHVDGDVVAYSSTVSDRTFKDDINTISDALDKIKKLRGVEYVWNTGSRKGKKDLGLIAQEVEEVLPEIVHEHEMPLMEDAEAGKTYKTVDYEKMVGVLIEAMKDQQAMIETLTAKVETLERNFNSRL